MENTVISLERMFLSGPQENYSIWSGRLCHFSADKRTIQKLDRRDTMPTSVRQLAENQTDAAAKTERRTTGKTQYGCQTRSRKQHYFWCYLAKVLERTSLMLISCMNLWRERARQNQKG